MAERSGNVVTVKLAVANSGTFDAYGIDAVMYSPDGTTTIGNNTVGGNGRVRPGNHVAVGSLIKAPDLANWGAPRPNPTPAASSAGAADRTYTFTAATPGVVGPGQPRVGWSDGAGGSGTLNLGSSYHAPLPVDVAQGLQVGFNTGTIAAGASFTVQALTPRDTFTYTVNSDPLHAAGDRRQLQRPAGQPPLRHAGRAAQPGRRHRGRPDARRAEARDRDPRGVQRGRRQHDQPRGQQPAPRHDPGRAPLSELRLRWQAGAGTGAHAGHPGRPDRLPGGLVGDASSRRPTIPTATTS